MYRYAVFLCFAFGLISVSACKKDETISGFVHHDVEYVLASFNGNRPPAHLDITFAQGGSFAGKAPCNRYFGTSSSPYPWFETGPIALTFVACQELKHEHDLLSALESVAFAEVQEDTLILSNEQGVELVFKVRSDQGDQ